MSKVKYEEITFHERDGKIRALFQGRYYFDILPEDLEKIGDYKIDNGIEFPDTSQSHADKGVDRLVRAGLERLKHINYNKPTVYIHEKIPLIGTNEFGIVDRGSNIIELKPITGCNFNCPYCSVDEGKNNKTHDYLVDLDYLLEEAAKIAETRTHPVEFHIGPQGEPMLYPKFVELVRGLKAIKNCKVVTVVTNGSLLTKDLIDKLAEAGLTKINLSLNALSQKTANKMSGRKYPLQHVLEMIKYCEGKINVVIAPTIVPGWNDEEIEPLVQLGSKIKHDYPPLGIQNFLVYKRGRNPVKKQRPWDEFYEMLKPLESKHGVKLTGLKENDFGIFEEKELPKPFKKGQIVEAEVVCPARYPNEIIAAAMDRSITVSGIDAHLIKKGKRIKVRIVRDKHNIFRGVL